MTKNEMVEIIEIVREVVRDELSKYQHICPLTEAGITEDEHKDQHRTIKAFFEDLRKFRVGFFIGIATAATGGIFGLIWLGIKLKLAMGQ